MKKTLVVLAVVVLALPTSSTTFGVEKTLTFDPNDPETRDIITVNDMLDSYIAKNDRENAERLMAYTLDRGSKYSAVLMIEFHDDLSWDKLDTLKKRSPHRWELFQRYLSQSLAWLSLSRKAEKFLGDDLAKEIKKELGEEHER